MFTANTMLMNIMGCQDEPSPYLPRPPRTRTCLSGKLVYGDVPGIADGSFTLDCMVRDISEGGAKVIIAKRQCLPPTLFLIVVKFCVAFCATVVWQNYPARGLKFSQTYMLKDGLPGELKHLRTLWANLHTQSGNWN